MTPLRHGQGGNIRDLLIMSLSSHFSLFFILVELKYGQSVKLFYHKNY